MTNGLSGTESANVSSDADSGLNEEEPPVETKESFEQKTKLLAKSEQQNAFSQALDYLTQIVQLQMPLRTPVYRSRMSSKTYSSKRLVVFLNTQFFQRCIQELGNFVLACLIIKCLQKLAIPC